MSVLLALVIVAVQAATGALWWRALRGATVGAIEAIGMGLALGTAAATTSGVVLFRLGSWAWAVPTVITIVALPWLVRRGALRRGGGLPRRPALVALAVSGGLGLLSILINLRNYPLDAAGTTSTYHPDMLFFEALSTSLAKIGPSGSIFMSGAELRYHWFTYAWSGQVAQSAGTAPFVVLTRFLPVVALVGALCIAIPWTQRLSKGRWSPTIAGLLIVLGGYVGATYGTLLNFDSPSQSLTTVWMLGLSLALLWSVRRKAFSRGQFVGLLVVIAVLGIATTGGKISSVAVVLAGWVVVVGAAVIRRETWRGRSLLVGVVLALASGATYLAFIAGSAERGGLGLGSLLNKASSVQGLNPTDYWWGILVGTGLLGLAIVPRWAGVLWLAASPTSRWRPLTLFSLGLGVSGLLALLLFSGGLNDTWFALAASAPLSVASAVGLSRAVTSTYPSRGWRPSRPVVATGAGALLLLCGVVLVWRTGPGSAVTLRWAGPLLAIVGAVVLAVLVAVIAPGRSSRAAAFLALVIVALTTMASVGRVMSLGSSDFGVTPEGGLSSAEFSPFTVFVESLDRQTVTEWSAAQTRAGAWLSDHVAEGQLVATNLTYSPVVPALSSTPMYVSAIQYQAPYGRPSALDDVVAREKVSIGFIDQPDATTAAQLCRAGVRWLWVDPRRTKARDWSPYATPEVTQPDVIVLRLDPSAC